jgi:hypothetical protein
MPISETTSEPHMRPHMAGDSAQALRDRAEFEKDFPEAARVKIDTMGQPVPPSRKQRQDQLALDAAAHRAGGISLADDDPELYQSIMRIGRVY